MFFSISGLSVELAWSEWKLLFWLDGGRTSPRLAQITPSHWHNCVVLVASLFQPDPVCCLWLSTCTSRLGPLARSRHPKRDDVAAGDALHPVASRPAGGRLPAVSFLRLQLLSSLSLVSSLVRLALLRL